MTNLKGEFNMQLQSEDSVKVRFSMIGYRTKTRILVRPKGKQTMLIQLADDNELQEVVVQGKTKQHGTTEELDVQKTKQGPSTSGNAVEELVQTQAGVSTHSELSSQYNVRGGTFDENSVYINNIEVFRPFLSGEVDSRRDSPSSIPTWLRASDSHRVASRQSMVTR